MEIDPLISKIKRMVAEPEGPFWWQAATQLIKTQDEATSLQVLKTRGSESVYVEQEATEEKIRRKKNKTTRSKKIY